MHIFLKKQKNIIIFYPQVIHKKPEDRKSEEIPTSCKRINQVYFMLMQLKITANSNYKTIQFPKHLNMSLSPPNTGWTGRIFYFVKAKRLQLC